jgi:type II secretory pathway predicted ATPase ExeA
MQYKHFGLCGAPFTVNAPSRLYLGAAHRAGLATLKWGFQREPSGLTLLVGEVGTGKTSLIQAVLDGQNPKVRIARLTNPTLNFDQMLRSIAEQLRIHPIGNGKPALLQSIKTFLMDPEHGDRVVLIFDEAQGLSDETLDELRLLSNAWPNAGQAWRIVLVGQPELAEKLNEPRFRSLNQRIGARAMLRPLRRKEIYDYVEHQLREQHGSLTIFSRAALRRLVRLSGGLPRRINVICHNSLLFAYGERSTIVKSRHVRAAAEEYKDVIGFSTKRVFRASGAMRRALFPLSGRGIWVAFGGLATMIALGYGFVFETTTERTRAQLALTESKSGELLQRLSRELVQTVEQPAHVSTGASLSEDKSDRQGPTDITSEALTSSASIGSASGIEKRNPPSRSLAKSSSRGTIDKADGTNVPPENDQTETNRSTRGTLAPSALSPVEETNWSHSKRTLSNYARKTIRYDIDRAMESQRVGRFSNAIWHLQRAVAMDPENEMLRRLLSSAFTARTASLTSGSAAVRPSMKPTPEKSTSEMPAANLPGASEDANVVKYEIADGEACMRRGDYDTALRKFKVALVMDPDNETLDERIISLERAQAAREKIMR